MAKDDGDGSSPPASLPPETGVIDARWDDDIIEIFVSEGGNPFDRVTTIPDVPPEEYVMRLMAEADRAERRLRGEDDEDDQDDERESRESPLSPPRLPVFERLNSEPVVTQDLDALALELEDADFDGHVELEIDGPDEGLKTAPAWPAPSPPAAPNPPDLLAEMRDRHAMGDFSGALLVAERVLESSPEQPEANRTAQSCRNVLLDMYSARLGSLAQLVSIAIPGDQIRWLSLDHRAGFLLSLVDGLSSIEEILDVSGMPRLDALRILCALLEQRVISLEPSFSR